MVVLALSKGQHNRSLLSHEPQTIPCHHLAINSFVGVQVSLLRTGRAATQNQKFAGACGAYGLEKIYSGVGLSGCTDNVFSSQGGTSTLQHERPTFGFHFDSHFGATNPTETDLEPALKAG